MTGNNSITINKATMIVAMEFWLKERVFGSHVVVKVSDVVADKPTTFSDSFTISLETSQPITPPTTGIAS